MQLNSFEYGMILHVIDELEKIKQQAEKEFNNYCATRKCRDCALYGKCVECTAELYFELKDEGVIK